MWYIPTVCATPAWVFQHFTSEYRQVIFRDNVEHEVLALKERFGVKHGDVFIRDDENSKIASFYSDTYKI